ncbi:MAG: TIGR03089 family protein [Actinocatenispora sp.]
MPSPGDAAPTTMIGADVAADVDRPLLTYCDDATGERTELTAPALGSWVARTASLLRDGCRLTAGDRAAVLLPPHWQTAAVLLGAWSIGVTVSFRPWATAGLAPLDPGMDEPLDAVFVARHRLDSWLESVPQARHRFALGLAPDGAVLDEVPDTYRDYLAEVRRYPDVAPAYQAIRHTEPASPDGTTYQQWMEIARGIAEPRGLRAGDRVLVDVAEHEQPVMWLLAPLSVGASVVLCANLDRGTLDDRLAAEGVTHVF